MLVYGKNIFLMQKSDGHGAVGHEVSAFLKEYQPKAMSREFESRPKAKKNKLFDEVFNICNSKLFNESRIDSNFSGSTCVSVLIEENNLTCANIGDSRAVVGSNKNGGKRSSILL